MKQVVLSFMFFLISSNLFSYCTNTPPKSEEITLEIDSVAALNLNLKTCSNLELLAVKKALNKVIKTASESYQSLVNGKVNELNKNYGKASFLFASISSARVAITAIEQEENYRKLSDSLDEIKEALPKKKEESSLEDILPPAG